MVHFFPSRAALPILLGLVAGLTWGAADFAGGLATRRASPSRVVLIAHGLSLLLLGTFSLRLPVVFDPQIVGIALLSGIAGGIGLMLFYEALALGAMGLSAAVAGLLTAVLPVMLTVRKEGLPGPLQVAGFAVAAAAIVLIAYTPSPPRGMDAVSNIPALPAVSGGAVTRDTATRARRAFLFAILAGLGFGLQLVWLHSSAAAGHAAAGGPAYAPLVRALALSRLGGTLTAFAALLIVRARQESDTQVSTATSSAVWLRLPLPVLAAIAGLLDTTGNGFYMEASLSRRLDVAAVLASLYPGATIGLAALFLHERTTRLQALGIGLALAAVVLIAA